MYPFPLMVRARGIAASDRAPYTSVPVGPSCRQRSTNSDGYRRPVTGRGFEDGWFILIWLSLKGKFAFPSHSANPFPPRAFSARPSWSARGRFIGGRQLGTMGIDLFGAQSTWRSHGAHHAREGIFKGNRRFPLERRFFWYFSFAGERKVQRNATFKSNAPINTNLAGG